LLEWEIKKLYIFFRNLKELKKKLTAGITGLFFFGDFIEKNVCHLDVESKFLFGEDAKIVCLFDIKNFT